MGVSHAICGAKTRDGGPCKNPPMAGQRRCRMHGGSIPAARRAGERRIAEVEAAKHVAAFGGRLDVSPAEALLELVQVKATEVAYWEQRVAESGDPAQAIGEGGYATPLLMLHKTQDQLASYSAAAIKGGADQAMVQFATMQAGWILPMLYNAIELGRADPDSDPAEIARHIFETARPITH
ncbi:HGGxSTG domain-containing protein [Propionimicrobium sp. PCR01-08-3]|uniref:HGGxSTG domain-containing protein n=1 Tax=Propionimicrobium sp. PCR01-08-3 TaxID=3052086 RepID=UPI00255D09DD|nr:HGGxSTG domain-containing protein [Propionimicrobium sp. PCR01-08-3]WIY82582.1 HGGxSTG domain-containing protein [Propionimicrobium sp. PCR01-08-3]